MDCQHLLTKEDEFNSISSYYGVDFYPMLEFFLKTEGCLILADDSGIVLAYRCTLEDPDTVSPYGDNLYIQYLTGNIVHLIQMCSDDIKNIVWDRRGKRKVYKLNHLKHNIDKFR